MRWKYIFLKWHHICLIIGWSFFVRELKQTELGSYSNNLFSISSEHWCHTLMSYIDVMHWRHTLTSYIDVIHWCHTLTSYNDVIHFRLLLQTLITSWKNQIWTPDYSDVMTSSENHGTQWTFVNDISVVYMIIIVI